MIDLHMHSKYSDGDYTVRELIDMLNKYNVLYASISDHNSVDGIVEYIENNYQKYYNGIMIPGTEIQALVGDYIIEVLVYISNVYEFKDYVDETRRNFWKFHHTAYQELLKRAEQMGLKYIEPTRELGNSYYCNMKFQEAIQACMDYNKNIIDEKILTDHLHFYRSEFQNPESMFFIDNKKAFPKLEEVLDAASRCKSVVSLAHIDEYKSIKDKISFLNQLVENYDIDALECVHPSISAEHEKVYMDFARDHSLLVSAGSDFHGPHLPHRQKITTKATMEEVTILKRLLSKDFIIK
ncbi:MAG: hypothetical protein OSJ65_04870 [Bacilli bacterium]|nr:hypothetical protein [Bacilli bacterium]